jgi:hypothetical protein
VKTDTVPGEIMMFTTIIHFSFFVFVVIVGSSMVYGLDLICPPKAQMKVCYWGVSLKGILGTWPFLFALCFLVAMR